MKSPNIKYLPALDHIRGYAALLVLLYHSLHLYAYDQRFHRPFESDAWMATSNPLYAVLFEGHTAVALFMVLSGFLFEYGASGQRVQYLPFLRNRLLRIYPLYLALCILGLCFYPDRFSASKLVRTLLFQANIGGALDLGSFTTMFWAISVDLSRVSLEDIDFRPEILHQSWPYSSLFLAEHEWLEASGERLEAWKRVLLHP